MIKHIHFTDFTAVPHLMGTSLMKHNKGTITLSTEKINILVGPNGSGKSSFINALTLRYLADLTGRSEFRSHYLGKTGYECCWSLVDKARGWSREWAYMDGMQVSGDDGAVHYYRPLHVPGNETSATHAMCAGFFEQGKSFHQAIKDKSDGQMRKTLLNRITQVSTSADAAKFSVAWPYGPHDERRDLPYGAQQWEARAEHLKAMFSPKPDARPLLILDEPEQSLDLLEQAQMWQSLKSIDLSKCQVLVSTHSIHPLLNPEGFSFIEGDEGYLSKAISMVTAN